MYNEIVNIQCSDIIIDDHKEQNDRSDNDYSNKMNMQFINILNKSIN